MPTSDTLSSARHTFEKFTFVGMTDDLSQRLHAQLGLLAAASFDMVTPEELSSREIIGERILILVYQDCLSWLQERMATGTSPGEALQQWVKQAESLLSSIRIHRPYVFVVNLDLALKRPKMLRSALTETYECVFRNDAPGPIDLDDSRNTVYEHIALNAFLKSPRARRIQSELEASTRIDIDRDLPKCVDIDVVYHNIVKTQRAYTDLENVLRLHKDLNDFKQRELRAAHIRTKQAYDEIDRLKDTIHSVESEFQAQAINQQSEIKTLENEVLRVRQSSGDLEKQINWTQTQLRDALISSERGAQEKTTLTERIIELNGEVGRLHDEVAARDAHIEAIRVSTSWRLTGPLRRFRRLFWKK